MFKNDYKPRVVIVFFVFILFYLIIFTRLYILQIYGKNFFKNLANQQYLVELKTSPSRGKVYDRTGKNPLALNIQTYSAFILPKQFQEKNKTLTFLKKNYKHVYTRIQKSKHTKFLWMERHLQEERFNWLKKQELKDIHFMTEPSRFYPHACASPIVGFTDVDNVGLAGTELYFNSRLKGQPSVVEIKKDARAGSFYFDKKIVETGCKGDPVILTLDSKLQFLAEQELEKTVKQFDAKDGSVLIMNPDTGEILVMANYPGFDPNVGSIKNIENTKNRIVTECYEFGSVIKTFTALVALEEGVVTPDEQIDCEGKVAYINRFRVENWKSVDILSFSDVIRFSSNVGIAKVASRLGPKFYTHLWRLGFGQKTGIAFPGERDGFLNPPRNWSKSSLIVMSFGYELMATLLQLGKAFSVIANGGYLVEPFLVKEPVKIKNSFRKKIYKSKTIDDMKDILEAIGSKFSKNLEGFRVMGKTGTARVFKDGQYSKKDHIYSFAGIIEKDDYRRVIIIFVKEPKGAGWWASQISAPLFSRVAEKMIIHDLTHDSLDNS